MIGVSPGKGCPLLQAILTYQQTEIYTWSPEGFWARQEVPLKDKKSTLIACVDITAPSERHLWMITYQRSMSIVDPRFEVLSCRKIEAEKDLLRDIMTFTTCS